MSDGPGSSGSVTPRLCGRCGKRMPPQKRGRPRRWCSQQCRQSAYEERHGLESWKDKQPKVDGLSDVVEVMQDRAARRPRAGTSGGRGSEHDRLVCVDTVLSEYILTTFVLEHVTDVIRRGGIANTFNGRILAAAVTELVYVVLGRPLSLTSGDETLRPDPGKG